MRKIDAKRLMELNEKFATCLINGDKAGADKLDEEIIQLVGTDGRVVINRVIAPPRLMYMYAFNRSMLQMQHDYVQEAVLSMIDVMETLYFGRVPDDIYFVFDTLAEQRGKHDQFLHPYELACDHLLLATLCIRRFPAMSLSFFWKAKMMFMRTGLHELEEFTDSFIKCQYQALSSALETIDPEGSLYFKQSAEKKTARCYIPPREAAHRPRLVPFEHTRTWQIEQEKEKRRAERLKTYNHHIATYKDAKAIAKLYPSCDTCMTMLRKQVDRWDKEEVENLPNIIEVLDNICFEEERYAAFYDNTFIQAPYMGQAHDMDGEIDTIVNEQGKYVHLTKGIIRNVFYRGQAERHTPCFPSLFRKDMDERSQFIERLKLCEFTLLMHHHPSVAFFDEGIDRKLATGRSEHHGMHIDEEALAQHYGIKTEYLDLTSDKWVAAFFACCDYQTAPEGNRDTYVKHTKDDVGVFYVFQREPDLNPDGIFRPIGMQPYSRPVMQAGYVLKMEQGQDFNTMAIAVPFRFDAGCSSILYWLFDRSGQIQPSEVIEMKAKQIVQESDCFSETAYQMVHRKYYGHLSDSEYSAMVSNYRFKSRQDPLAQFSQTELEQALEDRNQISPYLHFNTRARQVFELPIDMNK